MGKLRRAAILPTNIILLQNVVRRDPESYHEEFLQQYAHYESLRDIFLLNPASSNAESLNDFQDLIGFLTAVSTCYGEETANFPNDLINILTNNHRDLTVELREKIIQCLTTLRNKKVISAELLIQTIFPLLTQESIQNSKILRRQIYSTLISLLKSTNTGTKNQKLNRSTQALLFNLLEENSNNSQGLWATKLTRELWRRGIWDDSRTVEIMTQASLHQDVKVCMAGVRFFLGADKERDENFEENSSDEDEGVDLNALRHKLQINKFSSKRGKKFEQAAKTLKKKKAAKLNKSTSYLNFSAIHLLRDPQGFAESLFENHLSNKKNSHKFDLEQKILLMNLISRLIGTHKLTVLGIYSFFLKYLIPKQKDVTQIMASAAQASHDLVPPESINMVVKKIADEFVSDGVASEVASAGINTIREILTRAPLAIDSTLLQDLTEYKDSKAKSVMMAARSLISLYREVAPEMLLKKDRGKTASIKLQKDEIPHSSRLQFGVDTNTVTTIPGLELLDKWRKEQGLDNSENEEDLGNWEVQEGQSEDEEIEGEWVTVDSDKEYNVSSDDDDDNDDDDQKEGKEKEEEDSDLDLSSEDEDEDEVEGEPSKKKQKINKEKSITAAMTEKDREAQLAQFLSSRVLTPADFAKLKELQAETGISELMGTSNKYNGIKQANEEAVDSSSLVGPVKYKQLREERIAHAKEGKEDREKFGSKKGKRDSSNHSTTNREKARKKNFVMMIHKKQVQGKAKLSLRDKQRVLRAHITKQKKKGF
ncbi:hypothetical protein PACTADRAFT_47530 [Pachysolen tannophilus NRRL Y-2460]|uniref:Protein SDA1 n=1 Tax=Pachysolen tannophilus NRRL Y-2460 TaxID=669874 RepID=A0A1E4U0Z2_PACTA|nr:hypothetical protein PACTADRAFT_47530 [Pachysolen tannophilus NRRL Y-2460]